jgi:hypothetical protein
MQKILVAFDIDGTLRNNDLQQYPVAYEAVRTGLIWFASMKNTKIMVWSGGGELYARQCAAALAIQKYVDIYADKQVISCTEAGCTEPHESHWHFGYGGQQPDIAV